jgi:hypothetical protein
LANPTTNYGFVLPTSSDLVTDLPADFDVALQGVDTRLKALQPGTTAGDLAYSSATANTNTRLGIGTAGQVLQVNSGATAPEWATVSSGAMTLISTTTLGTTASTITFDSIASTFQHLRLVLAITGADDYAKMTFNNVTTSTYYGMLLDCAGTTVSCAEFLGQNHMRCATKQATGSSVIDIPNYKLTTMKKTMISTGGWRSNTGGNNTRIRNFYGTNDSTDAITRIDISADSTFNAGSVFSLYGVN